MTDRDRLIELVDKAKEEYAGDVTDHTETDYIVEYLLNNGVIVPPCKVGDTVYKLCSVNSHILIGQLWDGKVVKTNCDRCCYKDCTCYDIGLRELDKPYFINVIEERTIHSLEFAIKIMPYVGTVWFTTKDQAEQALKEREKNGNL